MLKRLKHIVLAQIIIISSFAQQAKAQSRLQKFDDEILIDLADHRTPAQTGFMRFMSNTLPYGDIGIPVGMMAGGIIGKDQELRQNALYVASSTFVTAGLTALIKVIVKRPRPFISNIKIVPVYRARDYSFPSGHTSTAFSTATAVSIAYPKWYVIAPSFLWAGTVGYSRMYLGVHYPTDVGTGALLGAGSAVGLSFMKK